MNKEDMLFLLMMGAGLFLLSYDSWKRRTIRDRMLRDSLKREDFK